MTTIVWANGVLAADSQVTFGNRIGSYDVQKIYTSPDPDHWWCMGERVLAFALAGDAPAVHHLIEALADCNKPRYGVHCSDVGISAPIMFHAFVVTTENCWLVTKEQEGPELYIVPVSGNDAIGSGEDFAMAALACGKDAVGAVEIAIQLDTGTGGAIKTWSRPQEISPLEVHPQGCSQAEDPEVAGLIVKLHHIATGLIDNRIQGPNNDLTRVINSLHRGVAELALLREVINRAGVGPTRQLLDAAYAAIQGLVFNMRLKPSKDRLERP